MRTGTGTASLPGVAWRWLLALALARLLLHLATNGQYGFHRDELAVLDDAGRPAWGYVAYPPLTPMLAHASMRLLGESLAAFRAPSALAQALTTPSKSRKASRPSGPRWLVNGYSRL